MVYLFPQFDIPTLMTIQAS